MERYIKYFKEAKNPIISSSLQNLIKKKIKQYGQEEDGVNYPKGYTEKDIVEEIIDYFKAYNEKELANFKLMIEYFESDYTNMPRSYRQYNLYAIMRGIWKQVIKDNF